MSGGTQNSARPPRQHPHPLLHQISIWAGHAAEPSAAPRCDGSGGTFQTVARRQVRAVRKRRRERTAVVFQRAAQVGTYTTERRRWFGGRRGWKSVRKIGRGWWRGRADVR